MEDLPYKGVNEDEVPPQCYSTSAIPPPMPQQPYTISIQTQPVYQPQPYVPPPIPAGNLAFVNQINYGPNGAAIQIAPQSQVQLHEIITTNNNNIKYDSNGKQEPMIKNDDECDWASCAKLLCYIFCCITTLGMGLGVMAVGS